MSAQPVNDVCLFVYSAILAGVDSGGMGFDGKPWPGVVKVASLAEPVRICKRCVLAQQWDRSMNECKKNLLYSFGREPCGLRTEAHALHWQAIDWILDVIFPGKNLARKPRLRAHFGI